MFEAIFQGFLLMGGLIVAIGAQNAFVLQQGLKREHLFAVCFFGSLADAALATLGVAGLGKLIEEEPGLLQFITIGGALFLFGYAFFALKRALSNSSMELGALKPTSLKKALATMAAFTFLNPHVYFDTVLLVGSLANQFSEPGNWYFLLGGIVASFTWFFSLGYGAKFLVPLFQKPIAWKILDFIIAIIMTMLAISLILHWAAL